MSLHKVKQFFAYRVFHSLHFWHELKHTLSTLPVSSLVMLKTIGKSVIVGLLKQLTK